jgi:hypothetical protein
MRSAFFEWLSFAGTLSADGNTTQVRWEISTDGSSWEPDFDLNSLRA